MHTISRGSWLGAVAALAWLLGGFIIELAAYAVETLLHWQERSRERVQLQQLDEHMLHDIGLSRADVAHECDKPFWRA
jgi:uncharacterized protein YjiS (DUF1127 family)